MSEEQVNEQPQAAVPTQEDMELHAFKTYVESSGEGIPENFSNIESYFSSLKESQSNYTKGQQEMAELRQQFSDEGLSTAAVEPVVEAVAEPEQSISTPELRIPVTEAEEATDEPVDPTFQGVDQTSYDQWGTELAQSGNFSDNTKQDIMRRTGFTEQMVDDFVAGQKSRLREGFIKASAVVGGQEKLNKIFDWASKNLDQAQQQQINTGLSSPSYEVTLRGLSSLYESNISQDKNAEPSPNNNLRNLPASESGTRGYSNKREFASERNDQRFGLEPRFRQMVEARMSLTDWNSLPK
jgi:hypothetical protein